MSRIFQKKSNANKTRGEKGGSIMIRSLLVDEYFKVAFGGGTGPMENESEYSWFHAHRHEYTRIQTRGLRREPGERDAGRAQLREAAAGSGHGPKVKAPGESYCPVLPLT